MSGRRVVVLIFAGIAIITIIAIIGASLTPDPVDPEATPTAVPTISRPAP